MNLSLLLHNIGFTLSALISLSLGLFVLVRGWSKKDHILYFLTAVSFVIFCTAHVLAINTIDPGLSKIFFILTNIILLVVCFNAHFGFEAFKIVNRHRFGLSVMYGIALVLIGWLIITPGTFVLDSLPKQYLPNFIVAGPQYWMFPVFFLVSALYFFIVLAMQYQDLNAVDRNRLNYFFFSFGFAYVIGSIQFLPIFGIDITMLPTALIGLYTIPLAYGLLKYDLIELHIVARNALTYFILVVLVGTATAAMNLLNNYFIYHFPGFPFWPIPFFSGMLILVFGTLIWKQMRQVDVLKYEFINNISHKFRTPLTHIRWLAEDLRASQSQEERDRNVDQIQYASMRLFELTNAVIDVARDDNDLYLYRFIPMRIGDVLKELVTLHKDLIDRKKLKIGFDVPENLPSVQADKTRVQFALQIIFENSLVYTPDEGQISIKARQIGGVVMITIHDSGIGISVNDLDRIFSKFYRANNARHADTEGMGIGLYMAKNIIDKHRGRVWASSKGEGQGSEFTIELPLA